MPKVSPSRPRVVLVIEDDVATRDLFRTALHEGGGYTVVAVGDGVDALHYLEANTPAAVVLDLGLTRLDGRDVYAEMKAKGLTKYVPVIVVTGSSLSLDEFGFSAILRKPTSPDQILVAVQIQVAEFSAGKRPITS